MVASVNGLTMWLERCSHPQKFEISHTKRVFSPTFHIPLKFNSYSKFLILNALNLRPSSLYFFLILIENSRDRLKHSLLLFYYSLYFPTLPFPMRIFFKYYIFSSFIVVHLTSPHPKTLERNVDPINFSNAFHTLYLLHN